MPLRCTFALALMLAISSTAFAGQVDNPQYQGWKKFKLGSFCVLKTTMNMGDMQMRVQQTQKLTEITDEKAVVELSMKSETMGNHTVTQTYNAKIDENDPKSPKEVGKETVTVNGKSYDCKVWEYKHNEAGGQGTMKVWTNEEVPGGVVKMNIEGIQNGQKISSTGELVETSAK